MRKLLLVASVAGALCATTGQGAFDGTVTLNSGPFQNGNGGEFTATTVPIGGAIDFGNFQTFCLEAVEHISFGSQYSYWINTGAVLGNGGAAAVDLHTGLQMDNISVGTAWLYSQFRMGTLAGYPGANHWANAGLLQQAIWWLEGEAGGVRTAFIDTAETALGNLINGGVKLTDAEIAFDAGANSFGVVALNLYNGPYAQDVTIDGTTYHINQDVLALVPEPTTMIAGALLLLPFGASTLRMLRKRQMA